VAGHSHGEGAGAHAHPAPASLGPRLLFSVAINVVIVLAQFAGGLLSNSLGLISDAAHNLSDVVALLVSYGAFRAGELPATPQRTFAYKRAEVIAAFVNAAALIAVAGWVLFAAAGRLLHPQEVAGLPVIVLAAFGLVANAAAALLLSGFHDLNARAAFLHLVADAASSLGVLVAGLLVWAFHWYAADAIVSAALSLWMIREAYRIARSSVGILLEGTPEGLDFHDVRDEILASEGVRGVHELHVWSLSSSEMALSAHVEFDECSLAETTILVTTLKTALAERFGITHATIEPECAGGTCAGALCSLPERMEAR
jgi:cobalt-zinc-cadmium efflux system protein